MSNWQQADNTYTMSLPCGHIEISEVEGRSDGGASVPYGKIEKPDYMIKVFNRPFYSNNRIYWPNSTTLAGAKKIALDHAKRMIDESKQALG